MLTVCKLVISCLIFAKLAYSSSNNPCEDRNGDGFEPEDYFEQALEETETDSNLGRRSNDDFIPMYTGPYEVSLSPQCNGVAHSFHWGWNSQPTSLQPEDTGYPPHKRQRIELSNADRVPEGVLVPGGDDRLGLENNSPEDNLKGQRKNPRRFVISLEPPPTELVEPDRPKDQPGSQEPEKVETSHVMLMSDTMCVDLCNGIAKITEVLAKYGVYFDNFEPRRYRRVLMTTLVVLSQLCRAGGEGDIFRLDAINQVVGILTKDGHRLVLCEQIVVFMQACGCDKPDLRAPDFLVFLPKFLENLNAYLEKHRDKINHEEIKKCEVL